MNMIADTIMFIICIADAIMYVHYLMQFMLVLNLNLN